MTIALVLIIFFTNVFQLSSTHFLLIMRVKIKIFSLLQKYNIKTFLIKVLIK